MKAHQGITPNKLFLPTGGFCYGCPYYYMGGNYWDGSEQPFFEPFFGVAHGPRYVQIKVPRHLVREGDGA